MEKISVGIIGYGNLGKFSAQNIQFYEDMELKAIFSRRSNVQSEYAQVYSVDDIPNFKDKIDVMLLCGGSATDLMTQGVKYTADFNTVDTFDTHAKIPEHFREINEVALKNKKVGIISVGWDPGLFSINRIMADAILPNANLSSFWGRGVSQGHSNAIRGIEGVADGVQFTVPYPEQIQKALNGERVSSKAEDLHSRVCYVVLKDGADAEKVKQAIVTMPNYFAGYQTEVNFISMEEFKNTYAGKLPHGGSVIASAEGGNKEKMSISYTLKLDSNPSFTSCVVLAYARAAVRLYKSENYGAKTPLDIPLRYLSKRSYDELLAHYM